MYEIFQKLLENKGIKTAQVAKDTGISPVVFSDWKRGKSSPKNDKMIIIAKYFGVSLEYLQTGKESDLSDTEYYIDKETRDIAQEISQNPDMKSLFDMSRKMSPERLKAHLEFMKKLQDDEEGK